MSNEPTDWLQWHAPYHNPASSLSRRLTIVRQQLQRALPPRLETPLRVLSICAGQGHDILGVLRTYPYAHHVRARLVELDERNVDIAQKQIEVLQSQGIEVTCGDAGRLAAYEGIAPADIVLICGVFGNISEADIFRTIDLLPQLCDRGATVIWTRTRRHPDITPLIREYLATHAFVEVSFIAPDDALLSVGVHRFMGAPEPLQPEQRMFAFLI
jgi:hypothetical protein